MATTANGEAAAIASAAATAVLDLIKPPQGVILPPPLVRSIIEKTAGFVARNGPSFETRIRDKEKDNQKFSFLSSSDAYNSYYLWRLSEIKDGRGTAVAAGRADEAAATATAASAAGQKPTGPVQPADFHFSPRMPNISAQDLEVVKLTALFTAKNGRQFATSLSQREAGNYQFDFLRPNHSLNNFFQHLVDQYAALLRAGGLDGDGGKVQGERMAELEHNVRDKFRILGRAKQRAEWLKYQETEKQKEEDEKEKERISFAQIDWHDFVVVETVVFTDADDNANLPPPTSLNELQYASLEQKAKVSVSANLRIEEAFPSGEDISDFNGHVAPVNSAMTAAVSTQSHPHSNSGNNSSSYNLPHHPPAVAVPVASLQLQHQHQQFLQQTHHMPPPQQQQQPQQAYHHQMAPPSRPNPDAIQEDESLQRIRERDEARARMQQAQAEAKGGAAPMKIKENYVPRAAARAANRQTAQMALCPNCKQQIPMSELEEHMRIELLDPRWKEQKAKADSRYATSNLTPADMANNLKRFASQRGDLFDSAGQPIISEEEQARRKRTALNSFDGNPDSARAQAPLPQVQNVNLGEQIARIHQRFANRE